MTRVATARMTAEQRMRMRRFEVVCQRAIARLQGVPEPSVEEALHARVLPLPVVTWRTVASDAVQHFGHAFVRVFQLDRVLRVWWWRRRRSK